MSLASKIHEEWAKAQMDLAAATIKLRRATEILNLLSVRDCEWFLDLIGPSYNQTMDTASEAVKKLEAFVVKKREWENQYEQNRRST